MWIKPVCRVKQRVWSVQLCVRGLCACGQSDNKSRVRRRRRRCEEEGSSGSADWKPAAVEFESTGARVCHLTHTLKHTHSHTHTLTARARARVKVLVVVELVPRRAFIIDGRWPSLSLRETQRKEEGVQMTQIRVIHHEWLSCSSFHLKERPLWQITRTRWHAHNRSRGGWWVRGRYYGGRGNICPSARPWRSMVNELI